MAAWYYIVDPWDSNISLSAWFCWIAARLSLWLSSPFRLIDWTNTSNPFSCVLKFEAIVPKLPSSGRSSRVQQFTRKLIYSDASYLSFPAFRPSLNPSRAFVDPLWTHRHLATSPHPSPLTSSVMRQFYLILSFYNFSLYCYCRRSHTYALTDRNAHPDVHLLFICKCPAQ